MQITHLSTEFAPIAKAGGMGDVLVGLVRELSFLKQDVEVILPKYDFIPDHLLGNLKIDMPQFSCSEHGISHTNTMWSAEVENCRLLLLESHHPKNYFRRGQIYGCPDDAARFLYFSKASLEYLKARNKKVDILHVHDWHTSSAAIFVKDFFKPFVSCVVLTIHNAEYQGICAPWDFTAAGLNSTHYLPELKDDRYPQAINLLKGGVIFADKVNTVSPSYAKEILTPEIGGALSATFVKYRHKIRGILNGIDQILWNPAKDSYLDFPYSSHESLEMIAKAKEKIREQLRKRFHLGQNQRPWVGAITRIASQKGPKLLEEGLIETLKNGGSFFLLGSSPSPALQEHFDLLKKKYLNNENVLLHFEYNEALAHQLYAALDFLLMPSLFEPCGLSQLIAFRYGTIPIVRKTGGLKDTVFDMENGEIESKERNGFVFELATEKDLSLAIQRAIRFFKSDPNEFRSLAKRVMQQNFSWKKPAELYLKMYDAKTFAEPV